MVGRVKRGSMNYGCSLVSYQVISAAVNGDLNAVDIIVKHYF